MNALQAAIAEFTAAMTQPPANITMDLPEGWCDCVFCRIDGRPAHRTAACIADRRDAPSCACANYRVEGIPGPRHFNCLK